MSGLTASIALAGGCAPLSVSGAAAFNPVTPFDVTISGLSVDAPSGAKLKRVEVWGESVDCSTATEQPAHLLKVVTWTPPSVATHTFSSFSQDDDGDPIQRASASSGYMIWIDATWKGAIGTLDSGSLHQCFSSGGGPVSFSP
jgi:hypothetical protein